MTNKKILSIKIAAVIAYLLCFFILQNSFNSINDGWFKTMEPLTNVYYSAYYQMAALMFCQWFLLGVLLVILCFKKRPVFHFSIGLFIIAMITLTVALIPVIATVVNHPLMMQLMTYQEFVNYLAPILTGYFLTRSLLVDQPAGEEGIL